MTRESGTHSNEDHRLSRRAPVVLERGDDPTLCAGQLVYVSFAGGICAATATEAGPGFGVVGPHLSWQMYAIIAFVLVIALAYLDIKASATVILALEGVSMLLVVIACSLILAKGAFHGHAFSAAPFRPDGVTFSVLGLGVVLSFSTFSGFEAAATLGEESPAAAAADPPAIAVCLAVVAVFTRLQPSRSPSSRARVTAWVRVGASSLR